MRSIHQAVVFAFTWTLITGVNNWLASTAHAADNDFLQDCATVGTAPNASPRIVMGRRGNTGDHLVVAVGQAGIYETRDHGETWDLLTPAGMCHRPVQNFWDNAPEGDTLCVVTPVGAQPFNTYCSSDRGRSWQAQTWIKDAVHALFDPSDTTRSFGWTPTNQCARVCAGPTYTIAMAHAKSQDRHCSCNLQLAHTAGSNPRLYALRDIDNSGQNQLVSLSRDMERESVLIREADPNVRMLEVHVNPSNEQSFLVTIAKRTPLGEETGLCCDALYETSNGGRTRMTVPLLFGPWESVQFTNDYGDIAALVHTPHTPDVAYIGRKYFGTTDWTWARAPEAHGQLLAASGALYFAGKHLYRIDTVPYTVIDPIY
jgi:hypothetical protein